MATPTNEDQASKTGVLRRMMKLIGRAGVTLGIAAGAVIAVQTGSAELTRRAEAAPAPQAVEAMPVQTQIIVEETGYEIVRRFVGQVEPAKTVSVSFELGGQLDKIMIDEGDTVAEGAPIAVLDLRLLEADLARLEASRAALDAQRTLALQTVTRATELNARGFASEAALDQAKASVDELTARIAEVEAGLLSNALQREKATVYAPFAGRVTSRLVDGGESLGAGQPIVELVSNARPQVRVGVPLDLKAKDLQSVEISVDDQLYPASLLAMRPDVDPITRTRTAIFGLDADVPVVFGQTVQLALTDNIAQPGFWVPLTILKEGVRGQWTVLGVDDDNIVRAINVQVVHAVTDRAFVTGAVPDGLVLVAQGPQRVTTGQRVSPQSAIAASHLPIRN